MKKCVTFILNVLLLMPIVYLAANAKAISAYSKIIMDENTICVDNAADTYNPSDKIQWTGSTFKIGFTHKGDYIQINEVDFGSVGCDKVTLNLSNFEDTKSYAVLIDDPNGTPVASVNGPNTGGWDKFIDVTAVCAKVTGVHTVYVKWLSENGGSLGAIKFHEIGKASPPITIVVSASSPETVFSAVGSIADTSSLGFASDSASTIDGSSEITASAEGFEASDVSEALSTQGKDESGGNPGVIIGIIAVVIVLAIGAVFYMTKKKKA